jgi:hypothetical protein
MSDAGVEMNFEGGSPPNESTCTVVSQSQVGEAPPGTHVTLVWTCPLRLDALEAHANELAGEPVPGDAPIDDYEVSGCTVLNHDEGTCDVTYYYADGTVCSATIDVTQNEDASIANVEQNNVTC